MLTEFQTSPVRIGDIVKISGKKGRCVDGTLCRVLFVDNLTCTGSCRTPKEWFPDFRRAYC